MNERSLQEGPRPFFLRSLQKVNQEAEGERTEKQFKQRGQRRRQRELYGGSSPVADRAEKPRIGLLLARFLADAIKVRIRPVDQPVSRHRRRGRDPLAKGVRFQQFELLSSLD